MTIKSNDMTTRSKGYAITIEDVDFAYDTSTESGIKGINLTVDRGECILLCGPSGCGKTTLTKLVNGLIPHVEVGEMEGKVAICGQDSASCELFQISERVASVFQNPKSQFFNIDPRSEISFALENRGLPKEHVEGRLEAAIADLGIEQLMNTSMFALSGGEKQIIAFACVYAADPEIIVLDEPSANLDAGATSVISGIIRKLKNQGKTIIIAEHRISYLSGMVDRAIYMEGGRIVEEIEGETLFSLGNRRLEGFGLREAEQSYGLAPRDPQNHEVHPQHHPQHVMNVDTLACSYQGKPVFDRVSFELRSGEVTAVVGSNGTGKSTLARCLCGLHRYDAGRITFDGELVFSRKRRKAGYIVMQDVNRQLFGSSVMEECTLGNEDVPHRVIEAILDELGLLDFADSHPLSLSGGQKQRVAVAVSTVAGKKVFFFDEPTSGLDLASMHAMADVLKRLADQDSIVCVVTHDTEFIQKACTRCILLEKHRASDLRPDGIAKAMASFRRFGIGGTTRR